MKIFYKKMDALPFTTKHPFGYGTAHTLYLQTIILKPLFAMY